MEWYISVLKQYAVFEGRARRKEYWMFALISFVASVILTFIDMTIGTYDLENGYGVLSSIYGLAILLPAIGVSIRRLHDTGRKGWWLLIGLIPLVGALVLIVFFAQEGHAEANQYGQNPKATEA